MLPSIPPTGGEQEQPSNYFYLVLSLCIQALSDPPNEQAVSSSLRALLGLCSPKVAPHWPESIFFSL
jgi:hypothetical protein